MTLEGLYTTLQRAPGGAVTVMVILLAAVWMLLLRRRKQMVSEAADDSFEEHPLHELAERMRLPLAILAGCVLAGLFLRSAEATGKSALAGYLDTAVLLLGAYLLTDFGFTLAIDVLLIHYREVSIPRIFYQILKVIVFVVVFLPILSTALKVDVTPILTTSAVFTMIIGLAMQDSLGNLFSGVATELSRPFRRGDWVEVAGRIGMVQEVNWRAATIRTLTNDFVIIPNTLISKTEIVNYSQPTRMHVRVLVVGVAYGASPDHVRDALIECALDTDLVRKRPRPVVFVKSFDDFAVTYHLRFYIDRFDRHLYIESEVRRRIWYRFRREGIEIPFPIRNVFWQKASVKARDVKRERIALLTEVDFLQRISEPSLLRLSDLLTEEIFFEGEDIVRQGDEGYKLYIIREGAAEIWVHKGGGDPVKVNTLDHGSFFGELSLLMGQKRSATVRAATECHCLVIGKTEFRQILEREPRLAERISEVLVRRQKMSEEELDRAMGKTRRDERPETHMPTKAEERAKKSMLDKIVLFFGL